MADPIQVLHVEDDPAFADLTTTVIGREHDRIEMLSARNASEGLSRLEEHEVDCIVSDFDMPGEDGIELLTAVREEYPELPFILFTGKGSEEIASEAISAGVTDYLQKDAGTEQFELLANRISNAVETFRLEQTVRETRRRFRKLVEGATDVVLLVSPEGEISFATPSAQRVLGRPPETLRGSNGFEPVHPDDVEHVAEALGKAVEQPDEIQTVTFRYRKPDGSWIWAEARGQNFLDDPDLEGILVYVRDVTDRKERERELRDVSREYEMIFESVNDGVFLVDVDQAGPDIEFSYRRFNETAEELVGYSTDEVRGKSPAFVFGEDQAEKIRDDYRQCVGAREPIAYEERLTAGEEERVFHTTLTPVVVDGEVVQIVGIARDITDQDERERELERYELYVQNASDVITVLGEAGTVRYQSPAVEHVLGYDPTELVGDNVFEYIHPDDHERVLERFYEMVERPDFTTETVEFRMRGADGSWVWLEAVGSNQTDTAVDGYVVTSREISDRKEREEEVRRIKAQLEGAVEAGAIGTWQWNVPEDELHVDSTFARKFGVDPENARGGVSLEAFTDAIHEADRDRVEATIEAVLEDCGGYEQTYRVRNAAGEYRWVVARGQVECDEDGDPAQFLGALTDITEQKRYEEQLEAQNERLEQFTSVVSHDLRNPLQVAKGRLGLAAEECNSEHLPLAQGALERMEVLIEDLLRLARQGRQIDELEPVELEELADQCRELVRTADATLVVEADETIQADRERLRQLFENLFRNSIEHTDGDVTITVGTPEDGTEFYVEDDGPGIPADKREEVFGAGVSTSETGTGFGLSIVREIAEAHGWDVRVTEGTDGGARFEFVGAWADQQ